MSALLFSTKLFPFLCLLVASWECKLLNTTGEDIWQSDTIINSNNQIHQYADIFIAGAINNFNNYSNAAYWKNGKEIILSNDHSFANDILVNEGDVFVGGTINGKPCYWVNGKCVIISKDDGFVSAIKFHKGNLYMVGLYHDSLTDIYYAFLWENNVFTILGNGYASVTDIAFDNNDIYIAGIDEGKPCYWENQVKIMLSDHVGIVNGIEIANNDVLSAGEFAPEDNEYYLTGYWKNKEFISVGNNSAYIWNVSFNKDKIYLVGSQIMDKDSLIDQAILIEDKVKTVLSVPDNVSAVALNIDFNKGDKYIIGNCITSTKPVLSSQVCYWLNNKIYIIGRPGSVCSAIHIEPVL
ncbi:hypothetical protein [Dyadobacter sediminis]|uniref:Uncharacterized protein n=1 Tax=Dyadobacter sediminis TaxID=1493691 RepID=A0A5R9KAB6_9BACT|nr:hypothetical protein [Dyadobacter sediminis]TLU91728.1 hypothetical protein FEM55_13180 [Dyadobacter sediminis]GGC00765.1 hypothetical protein GCM10011325_29980 [Dyadobacter sediminis]